MVKKIKSLFLIILLLFVNNFLFSQDAATNESVSLENDTSYFADTDTTAQTTTSNYKAPSTAGMIINMVLVLALVVAALYGIMRFFKKKNNAVQSEDDFMRRVSSLNFAPGKSVEIVTLVDRCFMLGVTDSNINLIAEITDKEMISALNLNFDKKQNTKKPMNFSDVLEMFMPNNSKNKKSIYTNTEEAVNNLTRTEEADENA